MSGRESAFMSGKTQVQEGSVMKIAQLRFGDGWKSARRGLAQPISWQGSESLGWDGP
jgi:hypothetical protein